MTNPDADSRIMEPRFVRDFSDVRLHTGSKASELSESINARAFTRGNNIASKQGEYQPGTDRGRRLLAHELGHVGGAAFVKRQIVGQGQEGPYPAGVNIVGNLPFPVVFLPRSRQQERDLDTGPHVPISLEVISTAAQLEMRVIRQANSGGHGHEGAAGNLHSRRNKFGYFVVPSLGTGEAARVTPLEGGAREIELTPPQTCVDIIYHAPSASGNLFLEFSVEDEMGQHTATSYIVVAVPELTDYDVLYPATILLVGGTDVHPDGTNHYLHPVAARAMQNIEREYRERWVDLAAVLAPGTLGPPHLPNPDWAPALRLNDFS